jgi:hypothetical protein
MPVRTLDPRQGWTNFHISDGCPATVRLWFAVGEDPKGQLSTGTRSYDSQTLHLASPMVRSTRNVWAWQCWHSQRLARSAGNAGDFLPTGERWTVEGLLIIRITVSAQATGGESTSRQILWSLGSASDARSPLSLSSGK